ncbi:MAG: hypothetical protein H6739_15765 [Alphaproteobacteria bacterium]|nr:hypothetical protein [Alphaproteobacteria bacterium]
MSDAFETYVWNLEASYPLPDAPSEDSAGSVTFVLSGDVGDLAETTMTITLSAVDRALKAAWAIPLPTVPADRDTLRIDAVATRLGPDGAPTSDEPQTSSVNVWPRTLTLEAKTPDDQPRTGVRVQLTQPALGVHSDGTRPTWAVELMQAGDNTFNLQLPGSVAVAVNPDHQEVARQPAADNRRKTTLVVKQIITAAITSHAAPGGGQHIRQWVNLDNTPNGNNGEPNVGHLVRVELGARVGTPWTAGSEVHVRVEFTRGPRRTDGDPAVVEVGGWPFRYRNNNSDVVEFMVELNDQGHAVFDLELGIVGGDVAAVTVGGVRGRADATVSFENWRKIYYELLHPDFMQADLFNNGAMWDFPDHVKQSVNARFAPCNIELDQVWSGAFTAAQARAGTVQAARFLDGLNPGRQSLVLGENDLMGDGGNLAQNDPIAFPLATSAARTICIRLTDLVMARFRPQTSDDLVTNRTPTLALVNRNPGVHGLEREIEAPFLNALTHLDWNAVLPAWLPRLQCAQVPVDPTQEVDDPTVPKEMVFIDEGVGNSANRMVLNIVQRRGAFMAIFVDVELTGQQSNQIRDFVVTQMNGNPNGARRMRFTVTGKDADRRAAVIRDLDGWVGGLQHRHPAIDPATGQPRRSEMLDVQMTNPGWATWRDGYSLDVTLPNAAPADPGSWVGEISPQAAPIQLSATAVLHTSGGAKTLRRRMLIPLGYGNSVHKNATILCHEIGHALGMTIFPGRNEPPPLQPAELPTHIGNGGTYYAQGANAAVLTPAEKGDGRRLGHQGPHCASGPALGALDRDDFNTDPRGDCIMWGDVDGDPDRQFCAVCVRVLKARSLTNLVDDWTANRPGGL